MKLHIDKDFKILGRKFNVVFGWVSDEGYGVGAAFILTQDEGLMLGIQVIKLRFTIST